MDKSSAEISTDIDSKQLELMEALRNQELVEQELLELQRQIIELQLKKKTLECGNSKAKHNVRQLNIEIKLMQNRFWTAKNSGV